MSPLNLLVSRRSCPLCLFSGLRAIAVNLLFHPPRGLGDFAPVFNFWGEKKLSDRKRSRPLCAEISQCSVYEVGSRSFLSRRTHRQPSSFCFSYAHTFSTGHAYTVRYYFSYSSSHHVTGPTDASSTLGATGSSPGRRQATFTSLAGKGKGLPTSLRQPLRVMISTLRRLRWLSRC